MNVPKPWTIQLVSPSGNVFSRRQLKDPVPDLSERFVAEVVFRYLGNRPIEHGSGVVLADPWRSLFNSEFHSWHKYRVIWGKRNFFDAYEYNPSCSNECDYSEWDLYLVGNGLQEVILSGSLPAHWWEWTEEERLQWLADPPSEFVGEDGNTYEYPSCSDDYSDRDLYLSGEVMLIDRLPDGWWKWTEEERLQWLTDPK